MKNFLLYVMAALYVMAGINHFWHAAMYIKIVPTYLPWHAALVNISGVAEIVLGLLLLLPLTRRLAAVGVIFLLIAIFTANIQMAVDFAREHNAYTWLAIARLPLQIVLVWWAWQYVGATPSVSKTK